MTGGKGTSPSTRMGDRGPRRAEARAGRRHRSRWPPYTGAGSDRALGRTHRAYAHTEPDQCIERGALGAIPASRWAARDSRSSGSRPRMRGLYRYTVCKRTNKPKARTAPVQSTPRTFVRGVLRARASATGRPAGSPAFYEHCFVNGPGPSESLDRPGRTFTAKPREKGARPRTHSGACGGAPALGGLSFISSINEGLSSSNHTTPGRARVRRHRPPLWFRIELRALDERKRGGGPFDGSYLVDPASSHMLVSKIKPCMSKYNLYTGKLRMAH